MITPRPPYNLDALQQALSGLDLITDPVQVAKLSQDYHTFSPILVRQLQGKQADIVVRPTSEAELWQTVSACYSHQVPVTIRGAGTGNYGQCVPLAGGVVLDMSKLNRILWVKPGVVRVQAGAKLAAIDKQTREQGWELRMVPSTYRSATLGGFIAGGSGGIGSITYGQLRDRGNLLALQVVTLEEQPRTLELRGDEVHQVSHAWGLNGIITELEMPLGSAYPWADVIVVFEDFMKAAHFGQALGNADGIIKKLISIHAWPIPSYFTSLQAYLPASHACALLMVAEFCLDPLASLVKDFNGSITYSKTSSETSKGTPLGEFTWNHTTLHARTVDPSLTYLQTLFPPDPQLTVLEHLYHHFGDEVQMHLEFIRVEGVVRPAGLQIIQFTTDERLTEIIHYHEEAGAFIANPHTYIIEDGGRKFMDPQQVAFKEQVDPLGLLNPGKMRTWGERHGV